VYFVLVLSQTGDEIESHDNKSIQGKKRGGRTGDEIESHDNKRTQGKKKEGIKMGTKLKVMITSVHKEKKRGSNWGRN
jgi:hypothetical protein